MVLYIDLDQSKQGFLVFPLKLPNQRVKTKLWHDYIGLPKFEMKVGNSKGKQYDKYAIPANMYTIIFGQIFEYQLDLSNNG